MKNKFKILVLTVALCIATAVVASAETRYETALGYVNKTYNLSLTGDYVNLSAQGTSTSVYTTIRNTSSSTIYAQATTKTCKTYWVVYDTDTTTNTHFTTGSVLNAPTVSRLYNDSSAKYIHVGTVKNVDQTTTYDSLTYRVNHGTSQYQ